MISPNFERFSMVLTANSSRIYATPKILLWGKVAAKNRPEHLQLRLSGLVSQQHGSLVVKNRIYQTVFNLNWVQQQLNSLASPWSGSRTILL
ncbi:hypothetical protein [Brasilonema sp. UFV-L1]|uniref:hypothetical protein n=2 Tax=Brasilonema sp. UFV-L1 TaxID=2234130 RepID=UPI00145CDA69|nr:hypothetical protein [Brasilonema sp. UFV-L1]NMG09019.1 hypothetical protein [Brasilonema sp. UFV-L1]